jgi:hypothetical protein
MKFLIASFKRLMSEHMLQLCKTGIVRRVTNLDGFQTTLRLYYL